MPMPMPEAVRRARWALAAVFFANGAVLGSWVPHIPLAQARLALGPAMLGLALLAMAAGALLAMPLTGAVIGRVGSAPVVRSSAFAFCAALPLPVMAPSLPLLVAALALFGAANGAMDVAMNAHAVAVEKRRGQPVMSTFHALFSLGGLAGATVGGAALTVMPGVTHAVAVFAVLGAALPIALARLLPADADVGVRRTGFARPSHATLGLGVLTFLVLLSEGAILDWSAVYLHTDLGVEAGTAAAGFAAFSAAMAAGRLAGDGLRQRFGAEPLARGSALLAAIGLAAGLALETPTAMVAGFGCAGLGLANLVPLLFSAAGRTTGQGAGTAIAAVATIGYTGFLVGPPVIGFVAAATTLRAALAILVIACAVVALSARAVRLADLGPGDGGAH